MGKYATFNEPQLNGLFSDAGHVLPPPKLQMTNIRERTILMFKVRGQRLRSLEGVKDILQVARGHFV
jgi:hypothetical protein